LKRGFTLADEPAWNSDRYPLSCKNRWTTLIAIKPSPTVGVTGKLAGFEQGTPAWVAPTIPYARSWPI
jgi:hypothetical protein